MNLPEQVGSIGTTKLTEGCVLSRFTLAMPVTRFTGQLFRDRGMWR